MPMSGNLDFRAAPIRTDDVCIGWLQLAAQLASQRAIDTKNPRLTMWVQVDEIGLMFRAVLMSSVTFEKSRHEFVRWDDLKNARTAQKSMTDALEKLARGFEN